MKHLVVTVHGIRTFGDWQERLEKLLFENKGADDELTVVNYKLGYFSVFAFISVFLRWVVVRRFRLFFTNVSVSEPWDRIDLVGHSFGTHVIAWAFYGIPSKERPQVNTIILSGSVLKVNFPWQVLIGQGLRRLINDCGTRDNILVLNQISVLATGMAGRVGFNGGLSRVFRNRFFEFEHSDYFLTENKPDDTFMRKYWAPLLLTDDDPELVDLRTSSALSGIKLTLLNNAEPIKLAVYATPFAILSLVYFSLYSTAENARKEAVRQKNEAIRQNIIALRSYSEAQLSLAKQFAEGGERDRSMAAVLAGLPTDLTKPDRPLVPALVDVLDAVMSQETPQYILPATREMAVDRQGKFAALGFRDGTLQLWDVATGVMIASKASGHKTIASLSFTADGRGLLSVGGDGDNIIKNWRTPDLSTGVPFKMSTDDSTTQTWTVAGGTRAFALARDGKLALWEIDTGKLVTQWQAHSFTPALPGMPQRVPTPVLATAVSGNGSYLATGGSDGRVKIWSATEGRLVTTIAAHPGWVIALALDYSGHRLATAGDDGVTRVWSTLDDARTPSVEIKPTSGPIWLQIAPDGQTMVLANKGGGDTRLIDLNDGKTLKTLPEQLGDVTILRFSPDGSRLLTASTGEPSMRIWTRDFSLEMVLRFGEAPWEDVAFVSNNFVVGRTSDAITTWQLGGSKDKRSTLIFGENELKGVDGFRFDDAGSLVAGKSGSAAVLWDLKQPDRTPMRLHGHNRSIYKFRFSSDSKNLVTAGRDGKAIIWSTETGERQQTFYHRDVVQDARVLADGKRVLTSSRDGSAVIWDAVAGKPLAVMRGKATFADTVITPDEKIVVSLDDLDNLLLWDASTGEFLRKIITPEIVSVFEAMPDNRSVIAGFKNGTILVYPFGTTEKPTKLTEHRSELTSISFSGDGRRMMTVSTDGLAAVWDLGTFNLVSRLRTGVKDVWGGELDHEGKLAFVAAGDGTIAVWRPDTSVVLRRISVADIFPQRVVGLWGENRILVLGRSGISHSIEISPFSAEVSKFSQTLGISPSQALVDFARAQVAQSIAPAPAELVLGKEEGDANGCDRLASHIFDPNKKTRGVNVDEIDGKSAESACRTALRISPKEARFSYQLGRALVRQERFAEAIKYFKLAIDANYPMAYMGRFSLYASGNDSEMDDRQAIEFLRIAAKNNLGIGAHFLAEAYWNGKRIAKNKDEAILHYRNAALLNYPDAHLELSRIYEAGAAVQRDFEKAFYHSIAQERLLVSLRIPARSEDLLRRASLARLVTPSAAVAAVRATLIK